jgi:acetoacetate decarboxylase
MAKLRYLKSLEQVKAAKEAKPPKLESLVRSLRFVYETDPAIAKALTPKPLEPAEKPEVCVTFSQVAIRISPQFTLEIGSAIFGVRARRGRQEGIALITMPMSSEQAVLGGRDTFGEPKKIAAIDFKLDEASRSVSSKVTRMGVSYLEASGRLGAALAPRQFSEYAYCYKLSPSPEPGRMLDTEALLVQLEWRQNHTRVHQLDGAQLVLRESPFDPVADVPVRRIVRAEFEEGTTESDGRVLESVPEQWVLPILHQRYDEPGLTGVEV